MSFFKRYQYWIHSGKFTAIQKLSTLLLGILSFMLLTRIMDLAEFGVWGLFLTISSITETARTSLIKNAFIRFMQQVKEDEEQDLQGAAFVLSLLVSGILSIIFLVLSQPAANWLNAPKLAGMLQWYAITLLISVFFAHFEMLLNAKVDFKGVCWMYCIRQGILLLQLAFCFMFRIEVTPGLLSIFYLLSVLTGSMTGLRLASPYLKWNFTNYRRWLPQLWNFGKFVFGNNVSSLLFRSTDTFITSTFFGTIVSGYYNACLRISNLVDMPSQVIGDIVYPKAAKFSSGDKAEIKRMFEKTVGATLVFSLPALLVIFCIPEFILHVIAGSKFIIAAPILRIAVFFGLTLPFLKQFGTIMDATGHPNTNFKVMFSALLIDIVANLIGVHFFGFIGAALGTATTYFIIFIVTQVILYKKFGVQWVNVFKNTFAFYLELFKTIKTYRRKIPA